MRILALGGSGGMGRFAVSSLLPLACGVKMFLDGVISQRGIHAPESGIIDPKIFLDYFAKEIGDGIKLSPLISINEENNFSKLQ